MPKGNIFPLTSNVGVGAISFETSHINAAGDLEFPVLAIPAEISLTAVVANQKPPAVHPISLISITGEFASPQQKGW
jgi:hypothetical protein